MCLTESLCCIAEINAVNQLYFNKTHLKQQEALVYRRSFQPQHPCLWLEESLWGAVLCLVGCFSRISGFHSLDARSPSKSQTQMFPDIITGAQYHPQGQRLLCWTRSACVYLLKTPPALKSPWLYPILHLGNLYSSFWFSLRTTAIPKPPRTPPFLWGVKCPFSGAPDFLDHGWPIPSTDSTLDRLSL